MLNVIGARRLADVALFELLITLNVIGDNDRRDQRTGDEKKYDDSGKSHNLRNYPTTQ
nr:hypothetical protein [Vibrio fluvialis]